MSIVITQWCDGCGTERTLKSTTEKDAGGWRKIPILWDYGPGRDEQPLICPDCQKFLVEALASRSKKEE